MPWVTCPMCQLHWHRSCDAVCRDVMHDADLVENMTTAIARMDDDMTPDVLSAIDLSAIAGYLCPWCTSLYSWAADRPAPAPAAA
eukprot:7490695-Pyramimonas_sp.AAC.1